MTMDHPARFGAAEQYLQDNGYTFGMYMFPLGIIVDDPKIQVRADQLCEDWITPLLDALKRGGTLIAPVVVQWKGQYMLGDGRHRIEAYRRFEATNVPCIWARLPKGDEWTKGKLEQLGYDLNELNGHGHPEDERINHGLALLKQGYTLKIAAVKAHVDASKLQYKATIGATEVRLDELEIKGSKPLGDSTKVRLHALRSDDVFQGSSRVGYQVPPGHPDRAERGGKSRQRSGQREATAYRGGKVGRDPPGP
jgi:hypothetical protein